MGKRSKSSGAGKTKPHLSAEFLEFFYPIHYRMGMALEDALRSGLLTRKQVAILWLIRSEGEAGGRMRRKEIEQRISTWFEVSSSAITKALRAMARPQLDLLQIMEDPRSGREKLVILTPKGEQFLLTMVEQGRQFIHRIVVRLSEEGIRGGLLFLQEVTHALDQLRIEQKRKEEEKSGG
jgi:DNA-binding MarR family transcriptional regulator